MVLYEWHIYAYSDVGNINEEKELFPSTETDECSKLAC